MKTTLEFKNLEEMYEKVPSNKRSKDILVDGESIFEHPKTPAKAKIIKTASRLIADYLKKHNIEQEEWSALLRLRNLIST